MDDRGEIETHRSACVSVIGTVPVDEFERRLAKISYPNGRFAQGQSSDIAARWIKLTSTELPPYGLGLIFCTVQSAEAIALTATEVARYSASGVRSLLAGLSRNQFDKLLKLQPERAPLAPRALLLEFGNPKRLSTDESFAAAVISAIEAIIIPAAFRGLVCIDAGDVMDAFADDTSACIWHFEAPTFGGLMAAIRNALSGAPLTRSTLTAF